VNGRYAHVRQRGHDMGHGDNTRDAGERNEVGGHVYYIERDLDLNIGGIYYMWLPYFSW